MTRAWRADLIVRETRHVGVDEHRRARRFGQELGLARPFHRDERPHRGIDRVADCEQTVVAEDHGFVLAERRGHPLALLGIEDDARVVVEEAVIVEERARVLGERIEPPTERRPRLAVDRMRVRRRDDVGARRVHLRVDHERGPVHPRVALDDGAVVVDADQVGDANVLEVHQERVQPEPIGVLRVAHRDVPGHALVEAELAEETERRREPLLAMQPLGLDGVETGGVREVVERRRHAREGTRRRRARQVPVRCTTSGANSRALSPGITVYE